eukprot:scaffold80361_cov72-Phaeocystis_antarctica.AAC.1
MGHKRHRPAAAKQHSSSSSSSSSSSQEQQQQQYTQQYEQHFLAEEEAILVELMADEEPVLELQSPLVSHNEDLNSPKQRPRFHPVRSFSAENDP